MSNEITKTFNEVFVDIIRQWNKTYDHLTDIHLVAIRKDRVGKIELRNVIEDVRKNRKSDKYNHTVVSTMFNPREHYIDFVVEDMLKYIAKPKVSILGYEIIANKCAKLTHNSPKEVGLWIICTENFPFMSSSHKTKVED